MAAQYILATAAVVLVGLALNRRVGGTSLTHPQTRTWWLVALIFAAVSAWLFQR
jgi:hypothetical protein